MNQAIIFNDDLAFDNERHAWIFTGMLSGSVIKIVIDEKYHPKESHVDDTVKFDWEAAAEDWLAKYEPVGSEILLELPF
ncbi:hypothetical protein [Thalassotalea sp. PLHSN55]|uniref:hypothetical protein n=1 Tax=Thalassotalea sp. PLHSN55 TaxID=3435888 RepID=UPI003F854642